MTKHNKVKERGGTLLISCIYGTFEVRNAGGGIFSVTTPNQQELLALLKDTGIEAEVKEDPYQVFSALLGMSQIRLMLSSLAATLLPV
jgi:hypothetical protein